MKFSVVIPTRNRLELLRDAVETVRRQAFGEWELIISDNASEQDIGSYVSELADSRIRYFRTESFLPVTDNWNYAMERATGEYVIMLGDDDGLTPNYFSRLRSFIRAFHAPDLIYTDIYQMMYPGVAPWCRAGYVADLQNGFFFVDRREPFVLTKDLVAEAVRGSICFQRNFTFNIQAFVFKRELIERLRARGPIFRSPFPDYYLANVALLMARSVVVVPTPMAVAGVTKQSFGFTLFNELEEQGAALLNTDLENDPMFSSVERAILPGAAYNTNYLVTMAHVVEMCRGELEETIAIDRYRRLQIHSCMRRFGKSRWRRTEIGRAVWQRLTPKEKRWVHTVTFLFTLAKLFGRRKWANKVLWNRVKPYAYEPVVEFQSRGTHKTTLEFFEALQRKEGSAHPASSLDSQERPVRAVGRGAR